MLDRSEPFEIIVRYDVRRPMRGAEIGIMLGTPDGAEVCHLRDLDASPQRVVERKVGTYEARVRFPGGLLNAGTYTVRVGIGAGGGRESLDHREAIMFDLHDRDGSIAARSWGRPRPGLLFLDLDWGTREIRSGEAEGPRSPKGSATNKPPLEVGV
jgi:hypothetical protein